jgi:transcriptional regulator NrdR family protein
MQCTQCDSKMDCTQTRNFTDPDKGYYYVERRRVCGNCGHRMYTVEIPKEELTKLIYPEETDEREG